MDDGRSFQQHGGGFAGQKRGGQMTATRIAAWAAFTSVSAFALWALYKVGPFLVMIGGDNWAP